jgi:3-oxoacyl-[acyl-carrier protein] reductase
MIESDDTVLVTGASRGLGLSITHSLLTSGYRVIGVARSETIALRDTKENYPSSFFFEPFDLRDSRSIRDFASMIGKRHGRLYGLVNNAGIGTDGVLATMHDNDINDVITVNLIAPMLLCKYFSRGMLINRRGRIINIASIIAGTGFAGLAAYGGSKAGLVGFTKSLSRELGKAGITVNSVSPGYVETSMTAAMDEARLKSIRRRSPFDRFPTAQEIAATVCFLLSAGGSGVHGSNVVVDLGSTA